MMIEKMSRFYNCSSKTDHYFDEEIVDCMQQSKSLFAMWTEKTLMNLTDLLY